MVEKSILILEDDVALAIQWSRALTAAGYIVHITHGAVEAELVFQDREIDLCVIDFMIHDQGKPTPDGGLSFLGKLGAAGRKKTKILGVSGIKLKGSTDAEGFLTTFGAERFLGKPFSNNELLEEIAQMLADS